MRTGIVFNIQRFSIHDGPGIRTTVFLKGCPLRCVWCHNPESQDPKPRVMVLEGRCIGCRACVDACPSHITPADLMRGHFTSCTLCGACVRACPTAAREIIGRAMRVDEVLEEVRADCVFYQESGGGVTVSGGEPLDQSVFVCDLLQAFRSHGIHTAVDTCGEGDWEDLRRMASEADLILFDLKFSNPTRHAAYTGGSNERILANLRAVSAMHPAVWLRVPVIPGLNDDEREVAAMVELAASLPASSPVALLPYHRAGAAKHARLGRAYPLATTRAPSDAELQRVAERFRDAGLPVTIGASQ